VAAGYLIEMMGFVGANMNKHAVDTQWSSFSTQGAGVRALEILEHAVSIGNEIGRHLDLASENTTEAALDTYGRRFFETGDLPLIVDLADA